MVISRALGVLYIGAFVLSHVAITRAAAPPAAGVGDYVAMCRDLEADITAGTGAAFDKCFNLDVFLDIATAGLEPPAVRAGAQAELRKSLRVGKQIHDSLGESGHYHLLRLRPVNGTPRALFRYVGQQGLNYHDLVLARDKEGKVCFTDFYAYASGELMSDTLQHMTAQMAPPKPGAPIDPYLSAMMRLSEMRQLVAAGKGPEAIEIMDSLPQRAQDAKIMQLLRVAASSQLDEAQYMKALESYRKLFADDPSADLVSLDIHLLKKNYDQFFAAIDRLDKALGGDPFLETMRAGVYAEKGDLPSARKAAERALAAEPTLFEAHDALLTVAVRQKDHAMTVQQLDALEQKFGLKWKDLASVEMFADFVKSPQYQAWLQRHSGPAPR